MNYLSFHWCSESKQSDQDPVIDFLAANCTKYLYISWSDIFDTVAKVHSRNGVNRFSGTSYGSRTEITPDISMYRCFCTSERSSTELDSYQFIELEPAIASENKMQQTLVEWSKL